VNAILDRYERDILPGKAPKTRRDDLGCIRTLRRVFGHMRIDSITTQHLAQYRDIRSRHPSMANREIAVLSHVWSLAREWGYTRRENPARGLRRCREVPRRYYADDRVWAAVRRQADPLLLNAMDLCYLTGQRVADVLKMRWADIRDGVLEVQQNKTGARLRILLDREDGSPTELRGVIERMRSVADPPVPWLLALPCGQPLTVANLRARFAKARAAAASEVEAGDADLAKRILEFQVRDIRPKAASDIASVQDASNLLGHTDQQITRSVYIRVGKQVKPTR
jgi:integrase